MDFKTMSFEDEDDMEQLRKRNELEKKAFLGSVMDILNDPLFSAAVKQQKNTILKSTPKRKNGKSTYRLRTSVRAKRRKSERLLNKKPNYTYLNLSNKTSISREVKKTRRAIRSTTRPKIIPVEKVTEKMIRNIFLSGKKVYGPRGTSCHHCRKKTVDTKTMCRSGACVGGRGQFCGRCVVNQYGEDPVEALMDPTWKCYVCRGCCNCSLCRLKKGNQPTGILVPKGRDGGIGN